MKINYPLLLDGGLSNVLESAGFALNHALWSAKLIESHPESIVNAHLDYLKAGAQCIITSSYQASIRGLMNNGANQQSAETLILKTVELAEKAIHRFYHPKIHAQKPLIAASIGPFGAFLADGSEYHGKYGVSDEELRHFHLRRIEILDQSNADFFACETIPSFQEAKILATILDDTSKSAWMSFTCKDGKHVNDGTPIGEVVTFLAKHPNLFALGINCTAPKYVSSLIDEIKSNCGEKKIVVYPNSGEIYNAKTKTWQTTETADHLVATAKNWLDQGADIIGGCCRIGPEQIRGLNNMFRQIKNQ